MPRTPSAMPVPRTPSALPMLQTPSAIPRPRTPSGGGGDAVCVETRNHPRLRAAVENVRVVLPTAWHITVLHGPQNAAHVRRELASIPEVRLRALPGAATTIGRGAAAAGGSSFGTAAANTEAAGYRDATDYGRRTNWYNRMLATSTAFWRLFDATYVLIFELDAALCPSPSRPIDSFKGFVLVGAPWPNKGCCNSGLSMWHRSSMLRLVAMRGHTYSGKHIDTWAAGELRALYAAGKLDRPPSPSTRVASAFSVEQQWAGNFTPVGVHAAHRFLKGAALSELARRCPPLCSLFPSPAQAPATCRAESSATRDTRSPGRMLAQTAFHSSDGGPTQTLLQWGVDKPDELGGGLNNMIMNLAQLINDVCPGGKQSIATLVLPNLTSGWRFFKRGELGRRHVRSLRFGEVFDAEHFIRSIRPCLAVARVPSDRALLTITPAHLEPINVKYKYNRLLPVVYRALRPGPAVAELVASHVEQARSGAGPRWSAVHLRIERDWWTESGFCRRSPRRCFPPDEVARIIAPSRAAANSTGAVLIYAADNLDAAGPRVRRSDFGGTTTKLSPPKDTAYTLRAASEFFAAAAAPGGFYGNTYSTFSRGVALLRWSAAQNAQNATRSGQRGGGLGLNKGDRGTLAAMGMDLLSLHEPGTARLGGGGVSFAYDCARLHATATEWRSLSLGGVLLKTADRAQCARPAAKRGARGAG